MFSKTDIEQYFIAEKNAGLFFLIAGIVAIVIAIALFVFLRSNMYKGLAWTFIVLGLLQAIVGYTIYSRSDKQRTDYVYAFDMNPGKLKTEELPRMQKMVKSITFFLWLELLTFIIGIILILIYRRFLTGSDFSAAPVWLGVGLALVIQSILMATADLSAYKRSTKYTLLLENFIHKN
ncbi:MAG: hypothetical protein JST63_12600 [Bacteroidetes bacterium]|nr:hypothetical protein [Bacteroidota bacterium]